MWRKRLHFFPPAIRSVTEPPCCVSTRRHGCFHLHQHQVGSVQPTFLKPGPVSGSVFIPFAVVLGVGSKHVVFLNASRQIKAKGRNSAPSMTYSLSFEKLSLGLYTSRLTCWLGGPVASYITPTSHFKHEINFPLIYQSDHSTAAPTLLIFKECHRLAPSPGCGFLMILHQVGIYSVFAQVPLTKFSFLQPFPAWLWRFPSFTFFT